MKHKWLVFVLLLIVLTLSACATDGEVYMTIAYQVGEDVEYINIDDGYKFNDVYVDKDNRQMYCPAGNIITLPPEVQWASEDSPAFDIEAESVCEWGQEKFDSFLALFDLVQEP